MEISLIAQLALAAIASLVVFSILFELFAPSLGVKRRPIGMHLKPRYDLLTPEAVRALTPPPGYMEIELPRSSHRG